MSDTPRISVVVCTYNRSVMLRGALRSLLAQRCTSGVRFEIVVVDDGSTDDTPSVVAELTASAPVPLRYVTARHEGVAAARNLGVAHALGEWIAFFDDDQHADPDWLEELVATAEKSRADCVAGRIEAVPVEPPGFALSSTVMKLLGDNTFLENAAFIVPGTGNALVRANLFRDIGAFDASLSYGEDADFFRRARRAGARIVYAPRARIAHLVPKSRLELSYLYEVAHKGASRQAAEDFKDGGRLRVLWSTACRIAHVLLIALPRLIVATAQKDRGARVGALCSVRFSIEYWSAAFAHVVPALGQAG